MTHHTKRNTLIFLGLALLALLVAAGRARAGGWAVVTLTHLPDYEVAGQETAFQFVIRQHGKTPWISDAVTVIAYRAGGNENLSVLATPTDPVNAPGTYTAKLTFPTAGEWIWGVKSGLFPELQSMPNLTVIAGAPSETSASDAGRVALLAGLAGLAGAALLGLALYRKRSAALLAGLALCLVVGIGGIGFSVARGQAASPAKQPPAALPQAYTGAELGKRLFLAKGCVVCHTNSRSGQSLSNSLDVGPNLTTVSKDAQYLKVWLADPSSLKPDTEMPKLGLSAEEIQALIAFLKPGE